MGINKSYNLYLGKLLNSKMRPKGVELPTFSIPSPMFYHSAGNASAIYASQTEIARTGGKKTKKRLFRRKKTKNYSHRGRSRNAAGAQIYAPRARKPYSHRGRGRNAAGHRYHSHAQKYRKHYSHRGKGRNGG